MRAAPPSWSPASPAPAGSTGRPRTGRISPARTRSSSSTAFRTPSRRASPRPMCATCSATGERRRCSSTRSIAGSWGFGAENHSRSPSLFWRCSHRSRSTSSRSRFRRASRAIPAASSTVSRPGGPLGMTSRSTGWSARAIEKAFLAYQSGRLDEAAAECRRLLARDAANAHALHLLGAIALGRGKVKDGIAALERASRLEPSDASIANDLGAAYAALGRWPDAEQHFRRALALDPRLADAYNNVGNALSERGELKEAEAMYRGALSSRPDYVEAMVNLGVLLKRTGRLQEAAQCYRDALAIDPALAKLHNNLGNIEMEFGRLGIAEQCFRQAVGLDPGLAMAHSNLGNVLKELGRLEEALACYREALRIEPDFAPAHSSLLLALNCVEGVDPAGVYAEHRDFARRLPGPGGPRHENSDRPEGPLRIGYVSGDLRDHPVAHFLEPVLARHDPASFRIFCYSNNAAVDAVTARIRALRVEWREVFGLSDEQVFDLVLRDGIDILVDLSGHTAFNRLGVFARKPAPVQVSWLGYLNTTGLDSMDYRIVDDQTAPAGLLDDFHSERLLRLPASQWCYEPPSGAPAVAPPPSARKGRVTFAS